MVRSATRFSCEEWDSNSWEGLRLAEREDLGYHLYLVLLTPSFLLYGESWCMTLDAPVCRFFKSVVKRSCDAMTHIPSTGSQLLLFPK